MNTGITTRAGVPTLHLTPTSAARCSPSAARPAPDTSLRQAGKTSALTSLSALFSASSVSRYFWRRLYFDGRWDIKLVYLTPWDFSVELVTTAMSVKVFFIILISIIVILLFVECKPTQSERWRGLTDLTYWRIALYFGAKIFCFCFCYCFWLKYQTFQVFDFQSILN